MTITTHMALLRLSVELLLPTPSNIKTSLPFLSEELKLEFFAYFELIDSSALYAFELVLIPYFFAALSISACVTITFSLTVTVTLFEVLPLFLA